MEAGTLGEVEKLVTPRKHHYTAATMQRGRDGNAKQPQRQGRTVRGTIFPGSAGKPRSITSSEETAPKLRVHHVSAGDDGRNKGHHTQQQAIKSTGR
jgi:hypothetical protein